MPLFQAVRESTNKHKSTAEDSVTETRDAKHFLSKLLNKLTTVAEHSLEQCSAALLGMPSSCKSGATSFVCIWKAMAFLQETIPDRDNDDSGTKRVHKIGCCHEIAYVCTIEIKYQRIDSEWYVHNMTLSPTSVHNMIQSSTIWITFSLIP